MTSEFQNVIDELEWRGAIADSTPGAREVLEAEKVTCYIGFDPTAKSLHIGNLIPIMGLVRMQRHGHTPIAIVGGGTGMIGDPSGRSEERNLLTDDVLAENVAGIRAQLERFLDFEAKTNSARVINNADWLLKEGLIPFLRDVGKHFTVNSMLDRESVKSRLERENGISFTEFSYQLLQAYDFLVLYEREHCTFQMGGTDQWGNILGGVDLVRRKHGLDPRTGHSPAHGLVYPLITTSTGEKFGKSIGGVPTLDPAITTPFKLYQFFLNAADADVVNYLKLFTMFGRDEIEPLAEAVSVEPQKREAQRTLAREMVRIVHGASGLEQAERVTQALFGGSLRGLSERDLGDLFEGAPSGELSKSDLENGTMTVQSLALVQKFCASAGEFRRLVQQGGVYLNDERVEDTSRTVTSADLLDGAVLVLRRGRKNHHLVRVVS